jgi:hypothetical protein
LTAAQLHAYRWDASPAGQRPKAVALVVPAARLIEGRRIVAAAEQLPVPLSAADPSASGRARMVCLTWDELLSGLGNGAAAVEDANDLMQLCAPSSRQPRHLTFARLRRKTIGWRLEAAYPI